MNIKLRTVQWKRQGRNVDIKIVNFLRFWKIIYIILIDINNTAIIKEQISFGSEKMQTIYYKKTIQL